MRLWKGLRYTLRATGSKNAAVRVLGPTGEESERDNAAVVAAAAAVESGRSKVYAAAALVVLLAGVATAAAGIGALFYAGDVREILTDYDSDRIPFQAFVASLVMPAMAASAAISEWSPPDIRTRLRFKTRGVVWLAFSSFCVLVSTICVVFLALEPIWLNSAAADGLNGAMADYGRFGDRKAAVDRLQTGFRCCGTADFTDWFGSDWTALGDCADGGGDAQSDVSLSVPFSCCDPGVALPCRHLCLLRDGLKYKPNRTIYEGGCADAVFGKYISDIFTPMIASELLAYTVTILLFVTKNRLWCC